MIKTLNIDFTALLILLCGLFFIGLFKFAFFSHATLPSVAFSRLNDLKIVSWRSRFASFPQKLHFAALFCLMLAFIDPHVLSRKSPAFNKSVSSHTIPSEGVAIYLILDRSGSMAESVEATTLDGKKKLIPKIDLLKQVTEKFMIAHPSDLMGLVSFARVPRVLVPLTLDQETLLKQLNGIQVAKNPEEDGTAIGYAIYKTAHLLSATRHFANDLKEGERPPYTIKSTAMIVVTDGFQDPSRLDYGNRLRTMELDDAAAYVKSQHIRLYVVNIDPALSSAQYAPQRRQLQAITSLTGGQFYLVSDAQQLQDIYAAIGQLEKGSIYQAETLDQTSDYNRFSLYPFFIFLGLIFLFFALTLNSTLFKMVP